YAGKEVEDGTMSLEDMIPALQGLSSAYGKIAVLQNPEARHSLRVTGVGRGTFHILIEAWNFLVQNQDQVILAAAVADIMSPAFSVVKSIIGVARATKHVKNQPYTEKINGVNQTINITNCDNVTLEVPLGIYQIYKDGLIKQDLNKITGSLAEAKIDSATIKVKSNKETEQETITLQEKKFFEVEEIVTTVTKEMWLTGVLNSLTKTTNRGSFYLNDGTRISYHLAGDRPEEMYQYFIYRGSVKIRCVASLDENLKPVQVDIFEIVPLQSPLV
ncbi:MAG: hypothetical protein ABSF47_03490, partial [Minisyncoccia bacterium]